MKAAYITTLGSPDVITYGEMDRPVPGPTDVLVRVEAAAVDPVDTFVRSGAYRTPTPFPFVLGRDLVGTVAETGPGATGFAVGDRVWSHSMGHGGRQGVTAEYCVVGVDRVYHLPGDVDAARAAAVLHPAATAHLALFRHARLRPGETVLVIGGAGNVGRAATVLAARAGARVLAVARAETAPDCLRAGATAVVDHRDPDAAEQLRELTGDGVDVHLDTSGHQDLDAALALVGHGARVVLMAGLSARPVLPVGAVYPRDVSLVGFAISNASVDDLAGTARVINHGLADDAFPIPVTVELPLSRTAEAHRMIEAGVRGRIVLRPE
ncbi:NADPH:quinone reductase [Pseudonocardia charpentierae]|uniref:NADPH:quinone reductase n=1 Tax=Pseudonocardia charpentierae TaxID=3075545 RepID=A0ABU2NI03_9PSEU|nr:NADPH:quinone reductase [Pseudonocardia sp. DSM 45834]MDT0353524.1 NADPH:quinone reductase [Pseudonocardia sp. DSM 45834]